MRAAVPPGADLPATRESTPAPGPRPLTTGGTVARAVGAIAGQGIQALASLVFLAVAIRTTSLAAYGRFTVLLGLLVVFSALLAGFRDAAIVLEIREPRIRSAANASQYLLAPAIALLAGTGAVVFARSPIAEAILFALAVVLWVFEEAGRRHLMSQLRFGALVANDLIYLCGAFGLLLVLARSTNSYSIMVFLFCMATGAAAAFLSAVIFQIGPSQFSVRGVTRADLRSVLSFAIWRSLHGMSQALQIALVRVGIVALESAAVLGRVEAGRLLVAPGLVLAAGLSTFLLPTFARLVEDPQRFYRVLGRVLRTQIVLTATGSLLLLWKYKYLAQIIVGDQATEIDLPLVSAWAFMLAMMSISQPIGVAAIALGRTREVFMYRMVDTAVSVALALGFVALGSPELAPIGLGVGSVFGIVLVWSYIHRPARLLRDIPGMSTGY